MIYIQSKQRASVSRMETRAAITLLIIFVYALSAMRCSTDNEISPTTSEGESVTINADYTSGVPAGSAETGYDEDDLVGNATFNNTVSVSFGEWITITNPLEGAGVEVTDTDGDVVITSSVKNVAYELTGSVANGSVKIYSGNKFKLVLNGVDIANADGPALGSGGPEAGIDCDARTLAISGGIVIGVGGSTSAPSQNASAVPSVILGGGQANKLVSIIAADGTPVVTFQVPASYSTLLVGGSRLQQNTTYTVFVGGEVEDGTDFNGFYIDGMYTTGESAGSFTTSGMVTHCRKREPRIAITQLSRRKLLCRNES